VAMALKLHFEAIFSLVLHWLGSYLVLLELVRLLFEVENQFKELSNLGLVAELIVYFILMDDLCYQFIE
jgi:hypothetical protein